MRGTLGPLVLAGALGIAACSGDGSMSPSPYAMHRVSGDSQSIAVHDSSAPLVVRLTGAGDTIPAVGVVVRWAIHSGPGSVDAVDTTGADGLASARFHSLNVTGKSTVDAQAPGLSSRFAIVTTAGAPAGLIAVSGQDQAAQAASVLPLGLWAEVVDPWGNAVPNAWVHWSVASGGGSIGADSTLSDAGGIAKVSRTLGPGAGGQFVRAVISGGGDTLLFHQTSRKLFVTLAGGNNVADRYTSDLWVSGNYAYTGTWGGLVRNGHIGNALKIWDVSTGVTLVDSIVFPGVGTVSDDEVSADGTLLLVTAESGVQTANGLYIYSLADPAHPALVGFEVDSTGLHTGTFADIAGQRYVFAAKDPVSPALRVFRIQPDSADPIVRVASVGQPANYGIHDTFVRDGLAFVSDWNTGLRIYDVGDGRLGGSPTLPLLIGSVLTSTDGISCNCVHNTWWYHDSAGGKRYALVGQEGPSVIGSSASGDIHLVDVSDMAHPVEVGHYTMSGAGTHNFWVDESRGILYAAYYNGGIVALDITGTPHGDLATREIARFQPGGGGNTYVWGVQLAGGSLWVSDMLSGLWKIAVP